jgi:hypothetical protein
VPHHPGDEQHRFERVCFEVDELDRAAERIVAWAGDDKGHVLVVSPVEITGRRLPDTPNQLSGGPVK